MNESIYSFCVVLSNPYCIYCFFSTCTMETVINA